VKQNLRDLLKEAMLYYPLYVPPEDAEPPEPRLYEPPPPPLPQAGVTPDAHVMFNMLPIPYTL